MQQLSINGFQLSPQQKRVFSLQQDCDRADFFAQLSISIQGNLNREILEVAWQKIVSKNEILRTRFEVLPGMKIPLQVIEESASTDSIEYFDIPSGEDLKQILEDSRNRISKDQLNPHLSLVKLTSQKHLLIATFPATIADGATLNNLFIEIALTYSACSKGKELDEEPLQYADLAEWQNELFESEEADPGKSYWLKQDASALLSWKLPWQYSSDLNANFKPKCHTLEIDASLLKKIEALCEQSQTSTSVILLACWQILLWRLTGQAEMMFGVGCDGRNYEELKPALGLLTKYLPVSAALSENQTISDILQQVHTTINEAESWQESFRWEDFIDDRAISHYPVSFDFQKFPDAIATEDLHWSIDTQFVCLEPFELKLTGFHNEDCLIAEFHYNTNQFRTEDIEHLAEYFQTLLTSAIDKPDTTIQELELLRDRAISQLLAAGNAPTASYPQDRCIHNLFEAQVKQNRDRVALLFEDSQFTYAQLNVRANQLAHLLQQQGVQPDMLVGLCVPRSLSSIVGMLGILKAGGAYLPLDPTLPSERLEFIARDAQLSFIVAENDTQKIANWGERVSVINLDADAEEIARQSEENPVSEVLPNHLAYAIYTSGSTGVPKGVLIEHRQLLNYLHSIQDAIDFPPDANFACVSTLAADLGNTVIFPSLCGGGCLHLISTERATNPDALADYFHRHAIDCLKIVPSHLKALLSCASPAQIIPRKRLILGGEAVSWSLVEQVQELATNCQIFNHYGPTETTVGVLTYRVDARSRSATVPIGRPLTNTQVYILDAARNLVPWGIPGELYIGGAGVARGYLNQSTVNSQQSSVKGIGNSDLPRPPIASPFLTHPTISPAKKLYKTGDRARYLPDGNLEFLGRTDNQVKIRGFRIELEEIEIALSQHPTVREVVVALRGEDPGSQYLAAYLVFESEKILTAGELRQFLQGKLPDYAIPSAFVRLKALPLTPNGKIDRANLPVPDTNRSNLERTFVEPRTETERSLAAIWSQVLRREPIGIRDNFFDLGGDSILSMQIVAKANKAGLPLTPKQLFECQTIAELATVVGGERTIDAEQGIVTGTVPLTPIQASFFAQNLSEPHHWNQSILLAVKEELSPERLEIAIRYLLEYHDALRLRFSPTESGWEQVNAGVEKVVPFTCFDFSDLPTDQQQKSIEATTAKLQTTLNLSQGPLVRVALFTLGKNRASRLFITIHHLAVDGVSWRIFLSDLQAVYQQGDNPKLPPKTTAFKTWSERLQEYARSRELEQQLDFWLHQPYSKISPLPVDFVEGTNTNSDAQTVSVSLSGEETRQLLENSVQINDLLLAALAQTCSQWTQDRALLLDLEGHGREDLFEDIDLSRTMGWFTSIFPVLLDIEGLDTSEEILKAVQSQLHAIPNRGIGYGILRYLSDAKSQLESLPQAQLRFNYLGQSDAIFSDASLFAPTRESCGVKRSLKGNRRYLLDINAIVAENRLHLHWTYSQAIHHQSAIAQLAENYLTALRSLIGEAREQGIGNRQQGIGNRQQELGVNSQTTNSVPQTLSVSDLQAEATLPPDIRPETASTPHNAQPERILLTGATGFLGAFLLQELLAKTEATIYCLVRSPDRASAQNKLQQHLESYQLWDESLRDFRSGTLRERVIPLPGDLSQPLLGLSSQDFDELTHSIDAIYHNGAVTNLIYPYSTLKAANVLGTQEILRLASRDRVKPVHYVSTISVTTSPEQTNVESLAELHHSHSSEIPTFGYAQTKWVAEKLVAAASDRGLPASIYRLGRIAGHSQTGLCNPRDRLYRTISGLIQLGYAPELNAVTDMTPVDVVSRAIVYLSQQETHARVFHLCHPNPLRWTELFDWMRSFGYPLQPLTNEDLREKVLNGSQLSPDNPLYPLLPFFADKMTHSSEPTFIETHATLSQQNAFHKLANTPAACPPIDDRLLSTYFNYLIRNGYLNEPLE